MSVTRVGTVAFGTASTSGASIPAVAHASTLVGDLVRVYINTKQTYNGTSGGNATTGPSGFTRLGWGPHGTSGANGHWEVWQGVATVAGAQTYTFTLDSNSAFTGFCETVRGQATLTPSVILGQTSNNAVTSLSTAAGTTDEDAELLTRFLSGTVPSGSTAMTGSGLVWDGACTKLADRQGSTGTGVSWSSLATETGPTPAGSVAARAVTLPNTPGGVGTVSVGTKAAPTGTPANTAAPVVTGTASVGSVLSVSTPGTWDQSVTLTYQWQRDGSNLSGATGSTYTVVSGDAGHTLRAVETGTNTNGAGTANSNGIAVPSAPINTVAPVVTTDGTPATGETITVDTGTWTGTGIIYTYQWYRGTSPISGETTNAYTLAVTDEGANVSCRVTATNGGGSATANSNTIVPAVTAPISDASFLSYLSGGAGNTDPAVSIGGARGGTLGSIVNNLLGPILGTVAQAGGTFYRVIYVRNTHTTATAATCKLFLEQQFDPTSGLTLSVAVPSQAVNTTVPALASGTTAPSGVTWSSATTSAGGLTFGNLGPGDYRGVYVRLVVAAGAPQTSEVDAVIAVEGSAA